MGFKPPDPTNPDPRGPGNPPVDSVPIQPPRGDDGPAPEKKHESWGQHIKHDLEEVVDEIGEGIGEAKFGE